MPADIWFMAMFTGAEIWKHTLRQGDSDLTHTGYGLVEDSPVSHSMLSPDSRLHIQQLP